MSQSTEMTAELIAACETGDVERARQALSAGAEACGLVDDDDEDEPPLHVACRAGHLDVCQLLCEHVRADAIASDGQTSLHCACSGGHLPVVEWLHGSGACSVDVCNDEGWTPLMCSAVSGHEGCARWLLGKGASPDATNADGRRAADVARLRGFHALAEALDQAALQAMADAATRTVGARRESLASEDEADAEPPTHLLCPLTKELMRDPVCTLEGQLYERAAIEEWLRTHGGCSPLTGSPLAPMLVPVPALLEEVRAWEAARGAKAAPAAS